MVFVGWRLKDGISAHDTAHDMNSSCQRTLHDLDHATRLGTMPTIMSILRFSSRVTGEPLSQPG
jgi:hypothetical protein